MHHRGQHAQHKAPAQVLPLVCDCGPTAHHEAALQGSSSGRSASPAVKWQQQQRQQQRQQHRQQQRQLHASLQAGSSTGSAAAACKPHLVLILCLAELLDASPLLVLDENDERCHLQKGG
jgi:hypothetical protein